MPSASQNVRMLTPLVRCRSINARHASAPRHFQRLRFGAAAPPVVSLILDSSVHHGQKESRLHQLDAREQNAAG
jgi:hypothetical protein